ncbi:hypothetical protein HYV10_01870 [Candidatus Dependentiae bacterium]|nr:hypothetical protein [Candidatus Dependentiae bacterium]
MHNKQGYILFLLFGILSVCSVLISLCFSRTIVYRQFSKLIAQEQQCQELALSSISLAESLFTIKKNEKNTTKSSLPQNQEQEENLEQKILSAIFPYLNKERQFKLTHAIDHFDATISLSIQSEHGKLNINSLYDFDKKKFLNEGKPNDCKKLCTWLFDRISTITGRPSLMNAFENILKNRKSEFNDPLELLADKDFNQQFSDTAFIDFSNNNKKLFLTDIFTVYTDIEQEPLKIINPLMFSNSWLTLLDLKIKENLTKEDIQKFLEKIKPYINRKEDTSTSSVYSSTWDHCFKDFYQKEYKDLPQEIKSILTTTFEVNIFSLLVKARIGETISSIFTIVKANTKQHLTGFDILKTSQI